MTQDRTIAVLASGIFIVAAFSLTGVITINSHSTSRQNHRSETNPVLATNATSDGITLAIASETPDHFGQQDAPRRNEQRGSRNRGEGFRAGGGFGAGPDESQSSNRSDYPQWQIEPAFQKDVFTFVRIQYDSIGGRGGFGGWRNDFPDCDWNFSVRLQQLTTMKVDPNGKTLRLDDPELFEYPFVFMTNMGSMNLSVQEQSALRRYLLGGGFLMADDFWAASEWQHIQNEMRQVLPGREPEELSLEHEIFHMVYNFAQVPQVPSIRAWQRGLTYEDWHGPYENEDTSPHFFGYYDDDRRMIALFCHNNDVADGWEREGEEIEYFQRYSLKYSYPLGINIITYAMTH